MSADVAPQQDSVSTPSQQRGLVPWQKGQSGNPAGRKKGSRNKLGEQFITDLYADWQEHGPAVIVRVRNEKPEHYLKVVAGILPQKIEIEQLGDLSDDQLTSQIRQLATSLGFAVGTLEAFARHSEGAGASPEPHEAVPIPALQ